MPSQATTEADFTTGVIPAAPWRVGAVSVLPGYKLAVTFRDGTSGVVDCSAIRSAQDAGLFAALADENFFARVAVELGVLTWPNGADLDPAWLHENLTATPTWAVPF